MLYIINLFIYLSNNNNKSVDNSQKPAHVIKNNKLRVLITVCIKCALRVQNRLVTNINFIKDLLTSYPHVH